MQPKHVAAIGFDRIKDVPRPSDVTPSAYLVPFTNVLPDKRHC